MRKEKALIGMLKGLVELLTQEATRNPEFSKQLDLLLSDLPESKGAAKRTLKPSVINLPDVHAELNLRGDTEFRFWLRDQPVDTLRAIIRKEDLDAVHRTTRWKDAEKLANFIADNLRARQARGSSFIGRVD